MKKNYKKIFAREFLFLIGTIIIFFLIFLIWYKLVQSNLKNEININNEIVKLKNQLPEGQKFDKYGIPIIENIYIYENEEYSENELLQKYGNKLETKIIEHGFLLKKTITFDESKAFLFKQKELNNQLEKIKRSVFNLKIGKNELLGIGLFLFLIFFIIRYIIYGTKWSIKQLKEQN